MGPFSNVGIIFALELQFARGHIFILSHLPDSDGVPGSLT